MNDTQTASPYCNHIAPGLREPESEFICRRYAPHSGSHSEDHNVTRMNQLARRAKAA